MRPPAARRSLAPNQAGRKRSTTDRVAAQRSATTRQGRTETFDPASYLANYADLQAAFGTDLEAATRHFIQAGYYEGRTDDPF